MAVRINFSFCIRACTNELAREVRFTFHNVSSAISLVLCCGFGKNGEQLLVLKSEKCGLKKFKWTTLEREKEVSASHYHKYSKIAQ